MNNVNEIETTHDFIDDQREWLIAHKRETGFSWSRLETPINRPSSTLSMFCAGNYNKSKYLGGNDRIALDVYRYRQTLLAQQQLRIDAPEKPKFFDTKASRIVMGLLTWAQRGRIVVCVAPPGIGKTEAAREYGDRASNAIYIRCRKSMKTISALCTAVLIALGNKSARGSADALSRWVVSELKNKGALLMFDDAQHLTLDMLEEIRGWWDEISVGVAFIGNEHVSSQMEGEARTAPYLAQLFSRVAQTVVIPQAYPEDAEALAAAWGVEDEKAVDLVKEIASRPGGLRDCTWTLENAITIARSQGQELTRKHVAEAFAQRASRPIAA
ncbi:AAA family ATPase [Sphingobium rhizovicinum]|uniref:AAA family ATPase n=1 Tax=Sphingobium rhizovicinum TaxID=432308 RepID=A0ABV7NIM0_9SPHN